MAQQTTSGVRSMPVNLFSCLRDAQLTQFRVTIDLTGAPELARTFGARQGRVELGLLGHPLRRQLRGTDHGWGLTGCVPVGRR